MNRRKILFVEKESTLLATFAHVLEQGGYTVLPATDSREAMRLYSLMEPGAVITNVSAPGSDGTTASLIEELRRLNAEVPIIATSGALTDDVANRALELGASVFIAKPFSGTELIGLLGDILDRGQESPGTPSGMN